MDYQKINNLVNTNNQSSILRTKNWAEVADDACENKQVRSKTLMLDSSFCDDSDAYILVKGTTAITGLGSPS